MSKPKNKVGRPTTYKPEHGEKILAHMALGYSLSAACGELEISRTRVYAWMEEHPEFKNLVAIAQQKRANALEKVILTTESGPKVTGHIQALKLSKSPDWSEVNRTEVSGPNGQPIETKKKLDVSKLTKEELLVLKKALS